MKWLEVDSTSGKPREEAPGQQLTFEIKPSTSFDPAVILLPLNLSRQDGWRGGAGGGGVVLSRVFAETRVDSKLTRFSDLLQFARRIVEISSCSIIPGMIQR